MIINQHPLIRSIRSLAIAAGLAAVASPLLLAQTPPAPGGGAAAPGAPRPPGGGGGFANLFKEPDTMAYNNYEGFEKLFDGASLKGWKGHAGVWRTKEITEGGFGQPPTKSNVIAAEDTAEHPWPADGAPSEFLIHEGAPVKDFELKVEFRVRDGGNGGILYRSYLLPEAGQYQVRGYQFDLDTEARFTGQLFEGFGPRIIEGRNIIAFRGQAVETREGGKTLLANLGDRNLMRGVMNPWPQWNQAHIIVQGNTIIHLLNGYVTAIVIDRDASKARSEGIISLQLEGGKPKEVNYRNVYLKRL